MPEQTTFCLRRGHKNSIIVIIAIIFIVIRIMYNGILHFCYYTGHITLLSLYRVYHIIVGIPGT